MKLLGWAVAAVLACALLGMLKGEESIYRSLEGARNGAGYQ